MPKPNILPLRMLHGMRFSTAQVFGLIRRDLLQVEEELERQSRSNLQILGHLNRYLLKTGGKRLRPALLLLAAKVFGETLDHAIISMAAVMEMLHTATLVHDDIIDGAEMRRGQKSVASQWGNDIAVLLGDWLYMTAFEASLQQRNLEVLDVLTEATRKMTEGELLQLPLVGNLRITDEEHLDIVQRKTGYLFSASCRLGGVLRGASAVEKAALEDFGMNLGIAFQLTDDLLDFTSSEKKLGKPVLSDLREGKVTLPLIRLLDRHPQYEALVSEAMNENAEESEEAANKVLAILREYGQLEIARDEAMSYAVRAQEALESLPDNQYRQALSDIAQFVVERDK
ncbi:MAG TPA: polyprenyl synthetase family protein [Blastocatellia bacterium]|nr:polyprenyl synthetase family protein [Blastocatellia bacterium]